MSLRDVLYSMAYQQANHVKRLKGGEPVAVLRDALIEPARQIAIQRHHACIKRSKVTLYVCQPTRASRRCHQLNSHLFLIPIGARTLKMHVPYSPPNVGAYTRTPCGPRV